MKNLNKNKKIIIICHCLINSNSKVYNFGIVKEDFEQRKKDLINLFINNNIGIIQLPCPELTCYGCNRWGHVKEQFDTPHFRKTCKTLLENYVDQIEDYIKNDFSILGVIGINGSPSCGVDKTCSGKWYGELSSNENLSNMLSSLTVVDEAGVFIEELISIFKTKNIKIPILGLDSMNIDKIFKLFESKI